MNLIIGSVLFGFILGFILGSRIKKDDEIGFNFTIGSYIVIFIASCFVAWQLGNYPYYTDFNFSTAFISSLLGIFAGKLVFARGSSN